MHFVEKWIISKIDMEDWFQVIVLSFVKQSIKVFQYLCFYASWSHSVLHYFIFQIFQKNIFLISRKLSLTIKRAQYQFKAQSFNFYFILMSNSNKRTESDAWKIYRIVPWLAQSSIFHHQYFYLMYHYFTNKENFYLVLKWSRAISINTCFN